MRQIKQMCDYLLVCALSITAAFADEASHDVSHAGRNTSILHSSKGARSGDVSPFLWGVAGGAAAVVGPTAYYVYQGNQSKQKAIDEKNKRIFEIQKEFDQFRDEMIELKTVTKGVSSFADWFFDKDRLQAFAQSCGDEEALTDFVLEFVSNQDNVRLIEKHGEKLFEAYDTISKDFINIAKKLEANAAELKSIKENFNQDCMKNVLGEVVAVAGKRLLKDVVGAFVDLDDEEDKEDKPDSKITQIAEKINDLDVMQRLKQETVQTGLKAATKLIFGMSEDEPDDESGCISYAVHKFLKMFHTYQKAADGGQGGAGAVVGPGPSSQD